jgi:hypothetical protein
MNYLYSWRIAFSGMAQICKRSVCGPETHLQLALKGKQLMYSEGLSGRLVLMC